MKSIIASVFIQVGVNIIGLPEFHKLNRPPVERVIKNAKGSKYHR